MNGFRTKAAPAKTTQCFVHEQFFPKHNLATTGDLLRHICAVNKLKLDIVYCV